MSQDTSENETGEVLDTLKDKYLTFHLFGEDYGIEIRYVTEIIGVQKITPVPKTPPYINGVINLRGRVIPIMDVRTRFHHPTCEYDERTCVIIVKLEDSLIGLIVDTVLEVVNIPSDNIQIPPGRMTHQNQFVQGLGKLGDRIKILLDVTKLLAEEEISILNDIANSESESVL